MKPCEPQQKCEAGPGQVWRVDCSHGSPRSYVRASTRLAAIDAVKARYSITSPEATYQCELIDMRELPPGAVLL